MSLTDDAFSLGGGSSVDVDDESDLDDGAADAGGDTSFNFHDGLSSGVGDGSLNDGIDDSDVDDDDKDVVGDDDDDDDDDDDNGIVNENYNDLLDDSAGSLLSDDNGMGDYDDDDDSVGDTLQIPSGSSSKDAVRRLLQRANISMDALDDEELESFLEEGSSVGLDGDGSSGSSSNSIFDPQQLESAVIAGGPRANHAATTLLPSTKLFPQTPTRPSAMESKPRGDGGAAGPAAGPAAGSVEFDPDTSGIADLSDTTGAGDTTTFDSPPMNAGNRRRARQLPASSIAATRGWGTDGASLDNELRNGEPNVDSLHKADDRYRMELDDDAELTGASWLNNSSEVDGQPFESTRRQQRPRGRRRAQRSGNHNTGNAGVGAIANGGLSARAIEIQEMVERTVADAGASEKEAMRATISELEDARASLQRQLTAQAAEHQRYRSEVKNEMKVAVLEIRRRQEEVLRKIPQVREELSSLRSYLEGDLTISDQLFEELSKVESTALTPRQLILLRVHEHVAPVKREAERYRKELAEVSFGPSMLVVSGPGQLTLI